MEIQKTIIVAYDFTERGKNAVKHALVIGKTMQARIVLLNVISNAKQQKKAEERLTQEKQKFQYDYELETNAVKGTISSAIKQYAEYTKALLIIMGTKNPSQGFEKIFGGQTLKIIMGSNTPFLVVRDKPKYEKLQKVVIPINFESYNKEKLRWLRVLSNFFNIKAELFVQNDEHESDRTNTKANFLFAKRYLDRYGIGRKTALAPKGVPFREALIEHTSKTKSDLMMIMTSEHLTFLDYIIGADEEYVIGNDDKIPVMCINPRIDLMRYSNFF